MSERRIPKIIAYDLSKLSDEDFVEIRRQGLGGSDAARALNMSKYGSPWELYQRKRGDMPPKDKTEPMYWGTVLEPVILARYASDQPESTVEPIDALYRHHDHEWMLATPDGLIDDDGILEVKTASHWVADDWEDGNVPDEYMIQGQWYCEVLDRDYCVFAVLIGGNDYRTVRFDRDRQIGEQLIDRCGKFWQQIQNGQPPATIHSDRVADRYPQHIEGEVLAVTLDELETIGEIKEINERMKELKQELDGHKNVLRSAMGEAETAVDGDHVVATWKTNKRGARTLSIK